MSLKTTFGLALASAAGLAMASCAGSDGAKMEYVAVQQEADGNWSLYAPDGTLLYEDEFKNVPSAVINGYFSVEEGKGYTLYKVGEKPEPVADCEGLKYVGYMADGLVPVTLPKERISLVDGSGKRVFTLDPVGGKEITYCSQGYSDGMLAVMAEDGNMGYVDTKGEYIVEPKYSTCNDFSEGLALVLKTIGEGEDAETKYIVINKKGDEVFALKAGFAPEMFRYGFGYLPVKDTNGHILFYDKKGEVYFKSPNKVKGVGTYNDKMFTFYTEDGEWGVMDYQCETLVRPKYTHTQLMTDGRILAVDDKRADVFDDKGNTLYRIDDYNYVFYWEGFGLIAADKRTQTFLDENGKPIRSAEFNEVRASESASYGVYSDYFNMAAVVSDVTSMITPKGVGEFVLGEAPSAHFSDPADYCYTSTPDIPSLEKSGYHYTVSVQAQFSSNMADYSYGFYGYDYRRTNYWRTGCQLVGMRIFINTQTDWGNDGSLAIVKNLEGKGYASVATTAADASEFIALLRKDGILVTVSSTKGASNGRVVVQKNTPETLAAIRDRIVAMGGKAGAPAEKSTEQTEIVETADTVAVEK